ncbi:hypothetical protein L210DRAFT_944906 [Boletus edulis BED1]|uniref:Uncharacterized protein n=1 Tax=Boletus edulis BED1 TaxID=1328754 RepID=A0AAD4BUB5_BOLED|nr:hypothetical protein L210DRAFT_944906 [Boletus edulis BED1]
MTQAAPKRQTERHVTSNRVRAHPLDACLGRLTSSLPRFVPLPSFLPPRPVPVPVPPPAPPDPLPPAPFLLPAPEEDAAWDAWLESAF